MSFLDGENNDDASSGSNDLSYPSSSSEEQRSADEDQRSADSMDEDQRSTDGNMDGKEEESDDDHGTAQPVNIGGYRLRGNRKPSHNHRLSWLMNQVDGNVKSYEAQLLQHAVDMSYNLNKENDEKVYRMQFLQNAMDKSDGNPSKLYQYVTHFMFN